MSVALPMVTGLRAIRGALRPRAILAVLLPLGLSLTLVTVDAGRASAVTIPVPVTGPSSLLGAVTEGGSAAGEAAPAAIAMAGLGAYNGTCWALDNTGLASLLHLPSGGACQQIGPGFLQFHFGSSGDDRSTPNWFTPGNVVGGMARSGSDCSLGYAGQCAPDGNAATTFRGGLMLGPSGSHTGMGLRWGYTCADGSSHVTAYAIGSTTNTGLSQGTWPFASVVYDGVVGSACGTGSFVTINGGQVLSSLQSFWTESGTCGGSYCTANDDDPFNPPEAQGDLTWTRQATWVHDTGVGTPWTMTWTQTCTDGTVTSTQTATASWTPSANGAAPNPSLAPCPSGQHVADVSATGGRNGNVELTIDKPTWTPTATTDYPLCTSKAPAGGCFLDLKKDGQSCFSGGVYCAGWTSNETRWNMTCEWGPYELAISNCEAQYGTTFDFETPVEPSQGPTTGSGGFPNPSQSPTSTASASTGPSVGTLPTTGGNPSAPSQPFDPTAPDPQPESQNCWGGVWSWDPVDWVYVPIKCALAWAFVPPAGYAPPTLAPDTPQFDKWSLPSPGNLWPGEGCGGVSVALSNRYLGDHTFDFADTCVEPYKTIGGWFYSITFLGVLLYGMWRAYDLIAWGIGVQTFDRGPDGSGQLGLW